MSIKDILIHIDSTKQSEVRLEVASKLAAAHGAHLIGLFVTHDPSLPSIQDLGKFSDMWLDKWKDSINEQVKAAEVKFVDAASKEGISYEWRCQEGSPTKIIRKHARYCDLLILGQRNPDARADMNGMPDSVILSVGVPVLLVPYAGKFKTLGERVMVGWDASVQATRAVHEAMPLMEGARIVDVIAINPGKGDHGQSPCADISLHLARHGIEAEAQSITVEDIGVADMLLSRAADKQSDLFVMGAYGHSRLRELVLGGVTAHMLNHMTIPVLMTH